MKQFADMVSDKVIEYLTDAKTQDMQKSRSLQAVLRDGFLIIGYL